MYYTEDEQKTMDTLRSTCVGLFQFLIENINTLIHNFHVDAIHHDHGKPLYLKKTIREYADEPKSDNPTPLDTQALNLSRPFLIVLDWLSWLIKFIIAVFRTAIGGGKHSPVSIPLPPISINRHKEEEIVETKPIFSSAPDDDTEFEEYELPVVSTDEAEINYSDLRRKNAGLRGVMGRFIQPLNELMEKIKTDDKALVQCYKRLKRLSRRLSRDEWTLLLDLLEDSGVHVPVNAHEIEDVLLYYLCLNLKKSIRRFPAEPSNFRTLYRKITADP